MIILLALACLVLGRISESCTQYSEHFSLKGNYLRNLELQNVKFCYDLNKHGKPI